MTVRTTSYKDVDGVPQKGLNKIGGADGKTETVTIGEKTYAADKLKDHDFSKQATLGEEATTTTVNPLDAIDKALAQVDSCVQTWGRCRTVSTPQSPTWEIL